MESALVVGASGGIGAAVAQTLMSRGVAVTPLSRRVDGLDVTDETSIAASVGGLSDPFDLVFVATGALSVDGNLPERALKEVTPDGLLTQFHINALGPMLVLKHVMPLMPRDKRFVFAALSARVGSIGDNQIGGWHSYRASKAALNQLIHGAAIEMKRTHKQGIAVCLHPGTVATSFTEKYAGRHKTVSPQEAASNLLSVIDGLTVAHSGGFYDYSGAEVPW